MKDKIYTDIICSGFCKYYKEGREDLHCNGYVFIRDNLTLRELKMLTVLLKSEGEIKNHMPPKNEKLSELVCRKCDFFIDGCDFAENRSGPPCGGYILISLLYD